MLASSGCVQDASRLATKAAEVPLLIVLELEVQEGVASKLASDETSPLGLQTAQSVCVPIWSSLCVPMEREVPGVSSSQGHQS